MLMNEKKTIRMHSAIHFLFSFPSLVGRYIGTRESGEGELWQKADGA